MKVFRRKLDLQAKISLVLVSVILPTFLIVTVAENKIALPILEEELRQLGINAAKTLAAEIDSSRWLTLARPTPVIENALQDIVSAQPDIVRIDVMVRDPVTKNVKIIASNIEDDPASPLPNLVEVVSSEFRDDGNGGGTWEVNVPIEHKSRDPRGPKRLLGSIHVSVSAQSIGRVATTLWKTTAAAAVFSVVSLILLLSYFLRKTIANDRLLRQATSHNLQLTERLQDAQRQLMNSEKLAVMGQLTASFAHEIGTPLNAIGGHLQLLRDDIPPESGKKVGERLEIVNGQLGKIESIVKGFLQSTAKPTSQKQLVDINLLADKALEILTPRVSSLKVEIKRDFDRSIGPIRAVPLDIEHILLNLLNNSLDSIKSKQSHREKLLSHLEIKTQVLHSSGKDWIGISVYDTGEGIRKVDLKNVLKPFFTTKPPGEGTGLGLAICREIAHKYGGDLGVDSKEGAWTRITLRLPYQISI
ncbi:MAG: ATP-binding protein [Bdellovibrionia bacterium]